jgi:hypothetical protein
MIEAARGSGGIVVVHVLNLWKLPPGPCVWQKTVPARLTGREVIILKGVHRCGDRGFVDLATLALPDASRGSPASLLRAQSVPFLGLRAEDLATAARGAGAANVEFLGSHSAEPYDPQSSTDLILVVTKR